MKDKDQNIISTDTHSKGEKLSLAELDVPEDITSLLTILGVNVSQIANVMPELAKVDNSQIKTDSDSNKGNQVQIIEEGSKLALLRRELITTALSKKLPISQLRSIGPMSVRHILL